MGLAEDPRKVDPEGRFTAVTDVHVHVLPERLLEAIRSKLAEEAGWSFPPPSSQAAIEEVLVAYGVSRYVTLPYAHRGGMAAELNEWVLERAPRSEMMVPFATVHPDDDVKAVVATAFEAGARGLKFQCPVQGCGPDDPRLAGAFELAADRDRPIMFHAGTAPMFEDSPYVGAGRFEAFLASYPRVRACAAHMGAFETGAFVELAREYDNAFLDTSYVIGSAARRDMGPELEEIPARIFEELSSSIMFGTDYPNTTFDYDDPVRGLLELGLSDAAMDDLLRGTATTFLGET